MLRSRHQAEMARVRELLDQARRAAVGGAPRETAKSRQVRGYQYALTERHFE